MKKMKTYALSVLTLSGLFLAGSLMRSRDSQAKGAYSTPVTVMNTNVQPGSFLDAERAVRIPYLSTQSLQCSGSVCDYYNFPVAAPGYRLVVENISGAFVLATNIPIYGTLEWLTSSNKIHTFGFNAPMGPIFNGQAWVALTQNVHAYLDAGEHPTIHVIGNFPGGYSQAVTISGYLENCALTGCPAIQE